MERDVGRPPTVYEQRRSRLRRSKRRPFVVALVAIQLVAATVTFLVFASVEESAHLDPRWVGAFVAIPLASILVLLALLAFGGVIASVPILVADCLGVVWAVSGIRRGVDVAGPLLVVQGVVFLCGVVVVLAMWRSELRPST